MQSNVRDAVPHLYKGRLQILESLNQQLPELARETEKIRTGVEKVQQSAQEAEGSNSIQLNIGYPGLMAEASPTSPPGMRCKFHLLHTSFQGNRRKRKFPYSLW